MDTNHNPKIKPNSPAPSAAPNGNGKSSLSNLWPSNFDGPQIDLSWHTHLKDAVQKVTDWHGKPAGGLVLAGGFGCGKTTIARIVLKAVGGPIPVIIWDTGQPESVRNAVFYSEPDLLEDIRRSYSGNGGEAGIIGQCQRAKLLILDDIGAGYVKEDSQRWYEDILWRILNERAGKRTLLTTNLRPAELAARIGGRAWSRLKEMLGSSENYVSLFDVPDYRGKDW